MKLSYYLIFNLLLRSLFSLGLKNNDDVSSISLQRIWRENIENYKMAIVTITSTTEVPFIQDTDSKAISTGFIVDKENGLIVTNRKAARSSPSNVKVQFFDGALIKAKVIYSDPFLPFGLLKIDKNMWSRMRGNSTYWEMKMGSWNNQTNIDYLHQGVLLVGTNDEGGLAFGAKIININRNYATRYGSLFQTSYSNTNMYGGSPVINTLGEVIGMHLISSESSSFELKSNYISYVIDAIKNNRAIVKGDIGVTLELLVLGVAKMNYKLNSTIAEEIENSTFKSGGPLEVISISEISPSSPGYGKLMSGDILYKMNNQTIGNDLMLIDQILNANVDKQVETIISRNGNLLTFNLQVSSLESSIVKRYVNFAGANFHEITNSVRGYLGTKVEGIYQTSTSPNSVFKKVSTNTNTVKTNFILTAISSNKITDLDSLINYFKKNCQDDSIYVQGVDFNTFAGKETNEPIDLDLLRSLIQIYTFNQTSLKWDQEVVNLNDYCSGESNDFFVANSTKKCENCTTTVRNALKSLPLYHEDTKLSPQTKESLASSLLTDKTLKLEIKTIKPAPKNFLKPLPPKNSTVINDTVIAKFLFNETDNITDPVIYTRQISRNFIRLNEIMNSNNNDNKLVKEDVKDKDNLNFIQKAFRYTKDFLFKKGNKSESSDHVFHESYQEDKSHLASLKRKYDNKTEIEKLKKIKNKKKHMIDHLFDLHQFRI